MLKEIGATVNRRNYLDLRFMDSALTPERDLGAELEMTIPPELRHPHHRPLHPGKEAFEARKKAQ